MRSKNQDIKDAIKRANMYQYEVANKMGIAEATLIRWLRFDLTEAKRKQIKNAIDELKKGSKNATEE